jgi:hypothetical protein
MNQASYYFECYHRNVEHQRENAAAKAEADAKAALAAEAASVA